ncbi:MAG: hypothetical protein GTO41_05285 [Burkholderiales bacterium]|nr:hypothetical protein [Burkholderiales bacterium]
MIIGLLAIGFPVALILAWAFELTSEGIKREQDVDRSDSISHLTGRRLDFVIIAALTIAVAFFVADKFYWSDAPATDPEDRASIAVLPFVPLSSGEDDGYFADGLTEEILNSLAQVPGLRVTARTSSFYFKGQNLPVDEIAARLNVAHIVEGSVRRDGDRLRITAQLIRSSDGTHRWSQTYDETLSDVFKVQEDIAEKIAAVMNVALDDEARRIMRSYGMPNVDAFIAYQKGREAFDRAHDPTQNAFEWLDIANEHFDQTLEAAPDLALVRMFRSDVLVHNINVIAAGGRTEQFPGEAQTTMEELRNELDDAWRHAPAGNQRDIIDLERNFFRDDWRHLPGLIENALRTGGGCARLFWAHQFIGSFGWAGPVAEKMREALACDPMNSGEYPILALMLTITGDTDAALEVIDLAQQNGLYDPSFRPEHIITLIAAGRLNDAIDVSLADGPENRNIGWRIAFEALSGNAESAREMAAEYITPEQSNNMLGLWISAMLGNREMANYFAGKMDTHAGGFISINVIVHYCVCGAPFDLEAVPNYKARIEQAGFPWPPPTRIFFPDKTW